MNAAKVGSGNDWAEAASIPDADEFLQAWRELPILSKQDINERFSPEALSRVGIVGKEGATGGSTGEPTRFIHDRVMRADMRARTDRGWRSIGWVPGMPVVALWGSDRDIGRADVPARRVAQLATGQFAVAGFRLDDTLVDRVLRLVDRHGPVAMYGYTSLLSYVAERCLHRGHSVAPNALTVAWNGAEVLTGMQSDRFEQAFGIPIQNAYGCREVGYMAVQSKHEDRLRVMEPSIHLELVDLEGQPVEAGRPGRVICTCTRGGGTPFVRYDTGDWARADPQDMTEWGVRALTSIQGRTAGLIHLPDGSSVSGLFWNHLLKEYPRITGFQVRIRASSVRLILAGTPLDEADQIRLESTIRKRLTHLDLTVEWVQRIMPGPQGKLAQIIREEE